MSVKPTGTPVFTSMDSMSQYLTDLDRDPLPTSPPAQAATPSSSISVSSHPSSFYTPSPGQESRDRELERARADYDKAERRLERENGEAANEAMARADERLQRARDAAGKY